MTQVNERYLAAICMRQPDMMQALQIRPDKFLDPAAKAVIKVLHTNGPAFGSPAAMHAALVELPEELLQSDVADVFEKYPDFDLTIQDVEPILRIVENTNAESRFNKKIRQGYEDYTAGRMKSQDFMNWANQQWMSVRLGQEVNRDAKSALEQLRTQGPTVRFPVGRGRDSTWGFLDFDFWGNDVDGKPAEGLFGRGEVSYISAGYKAGKTTTAIDFAVRLLDNGARVGYAILEDDKNVLNTKLLANKAGVKRRFVADYLSGNYADVSTEGSEIAAKIQSAVEWFEELGDRWITIDSADPVYDIHDWNQLRDAITILRYRYNLDIFFFDYLQEITEEYDELKAIVVDIRKTASRNNVHICVLSQMSNDAYERGGTTGRISTRGTGNAGATAHWALELWQDHETGEVIVKMEIARNSMKRKVYVKWDWATGTVAHYGVESLYPQTTEKKGGRGGRRSS